MSHGSYRVVYAYECSIMQFVTGWTNVACLRGRIFSCRNQSPPISGQFQHNSFYQSLKKYFIHFKYIVRHCWWWWLMMITKTMKADKPESLINDGWKTGTLYCDFCCHIIRNLQRWLSPSLGTLISRILAAYCLYCTQKQKHHVK